MRRKHIILGPNTIEPETGPKSPSWEPAGKKAAENCTVSMPGIAVGRLIALRDMRIPLVDFPLNITGCALAARATVPISEMHVGREVVLVFEDGDPDRPIVIGVMQNQASDSPAETVTFEINNGTVTLSGEDKLVLKCGEASITLTRAGKVLTRGTYLSSRSSGAHRIRGGSVEIN